MNKIKIISFFSAAHFLPNYKGKCESLHGHNWKVEVTVAASKLNSSGMVMDFNELKKLTANVILELDHHNLNDIDYFKKHKPSSEEISRYIFVRLKEEILRKGCRLLELTVWETENSCAVYSEQ